MSAIPTYEVHDLRRRRFEIMDAYQKLIQRQGRDRAAVANLLAQQDSELAALGRLFVRRACDYVWCSAADTQTGAWACS